jgi:hypothetical protein
MSRFQQNPSVDLFTECKALYGRPPLLLRGILTTNQLAAWYMDKLHADFADIFGPTDIRKAMVERLRSQVQDKRNTKK